MRKWPRLVPSFYCSTWHVYFDLPHDGLADLRQEDDWSFEISSETFGCRCLRHVYPPFCERRGVERKATLWWRLSDGWHYGLAPSLRPLVFETGFSLFWSAECLVLRILRSCKTPILETRPCRSFHHPSLQVLRFSASPVSVDVLVRFLQVTWEQEMQVSAWVP